MQLPNIKGNVTAKSYNGWIELNAFNLTAERPIITKSGKVVDRVRGITTARELLISKRQDPATPHLFMATCIGHKAIPEVKITLCRNEQPFLEYIFHNVLFSSLHTDVEKLGHDINSEELLTLNFTSVEARYIPYTSDGKPQAPISTSHTLHSSKPAKLQPKMKLNYFVVTPYSTLAKLDAHTPLATYLGDSASFNDYFDSEQMNGMPSSNIAKAGLIGLAAYTANKALHYTEGSRLLEKLKKHQSQIVKIMPENGGVLAIALYDIGALEPSAMEINLLEALLIEGGNDFRQLIFKDKRRSKIESLPEGNKKRVHLYLWITQQSL